MNFLSVNIRGLGEGDKNKAGWIKNLKSENGIYFIALQEIQFSDVSDNGLREYEMKGRKFTYLNEIGNKHSKIDRVLVSHEFFSEWPVACLRALPRFLSDHCPLVLTCLDKNFGPKPFRCLNSWLERKDFDEVIQKACDNFVGVGESDVRLMKKLKEIREAIKVWKKEVLSKDGEMEMALKEELDILDEMSEGRELSEEEEWTKMECQKGIKDLEGYKIKDLKHRARARWDLEGDENSTFFHGYIKSRRAFNNILGLMIDGVWTTKPSLLKKEIMGFFKKAFEEKIKDRPKLTCHNVRRLSEVDAASLTTPFSKEEIKNAVFECGSDKALAPDGFNLKFVKSKGTTAVGCSSSFITLILKNKDPVGLRQYRTINLNGVISKTISKILANRLKRVIGTIISKNQTAFLRGRYILDSPLILNKIIA
ncbi:uncharacterized protein LOC110866871 [Helianthus annuus]|uniref:uncharacterized protein LOC110866871 n=1 Tax=Helianthus annuus TaxID=4232 RepID=UPI00165303AC|nr:uncharacterized protein LOC110866871 [Helianthus annuus]